MDDVGTQRAHAKVAIAALASLYSTASADERGLAAVELRGMRALVTAAQDPDMNRVLGLGLWPHEMTAWSPLTCPGHPLTVAHQVATNSSRGGSLDG